MTLPEGIFDGIQQMNPRTLVTEQQNILCRKATRHVLMMAGSYNRRLAQVRRDP